MRKTKKTKKVEEVSSPILEIKEYHPLGNLSDKDLQQELATIQKEMVRRQDAKKKLEFEAMVKRQQVIYKNLDALLEMVGHSGSSCTDKSPCNPYDHDCPRCWLLYIKEDAGIYDNLELTFQIKEN